MPDDPISALNTLIAEGGVSPLVIGAHALQELGVPRQTFDLDLMIAETDKESIAKILLDDGYTSVAETKNFQRFSHPRPERMDIDLLFVDSSTFEKLAAHSSTSKSGTSTLRIPSIPHFIALKLHAIRNNPKREARDLGDIAELLRARPGVLSPQQLEESCRKFGPKGVYSKLRELI